MTRWIRTPEELEGLADSLEGSRALALDSESDSLYHHFEKVCLVQLATDRGEGWLIDPLAVRDLTALGPLMADPGVVKVLHGADYDVTTLKRDFGFAFAGLFDTMIAARYLGMPEIGLQAVAKAELGAVLSKDSQKDDWSRRPLTPRQEAYAAADVEHLLALRARLEANLREKGRLEWVREECDAVAGLEPARRRKDPDAWQRIKGARRLKPRALAALRELLAWREARAEATDVPAFKILGNEALLALAEKGPRNPGELAQVRGVLPRLRDHAGALLDALARARALPEQELPSFPPAPRPQGLAGSNGPIAGPRCFRGAPPEAHRPPGRGRPARVCRPRRDRGPPALEDTRLRPGDPGHPRPRLLTGSLFVPRTASAAGFIPAKRAGGLGGATQHPPA